MTTRSPTLRRAAAIALFLAPLLVLAGVAVERYLHRLAERKLAHIERRLAPHVRMSHGGVDLDLLPPHLSIRDLAITDRNGGSLGIRRMVVHEIDRAHSPPHDVDLAFEGLSASLEGVSGSELVDGLRALGYTRLTGDGRLAYRWDDRRQTLVLEELLLQVPELADLRLTAKLGGVNPPRLRSGGVVPLLLEELDVDYRDRSLLARVAGLIRAEEPDLRRELIAGLDDVVGEFASDGPVERNRAALHGLLAGAGKLRARIRLGEPVTGEEFASQHVLSRMLSHFRLELEAGPASAATAPRVGPRTAGRFFDRVRDYDAPSTTTVLTGDGQLFGYVGQEMRFPVDLEALPPHITHAFLAAEDASFYEHEGVDPTAVFRAILRNVQAGDVLQGGSTITQQLIKRLVVGPEKSLGRKLKEAVLALRLEQVIPKVEILRIYLDQIYFGTGAYGVEAAANTYFAKPASRLTVAEAALIAGLPRAPSVNNPYRAPEAALARQRHILKRMRDLGRLSASEHGRAVDQQLQYRSTEEGVWTAGSWYMEEVRRWLASSFGGVSGLEVRAAIDLTHQAAAERAVGLGLEEANERIGSSGARLEAALLSIDPRTGQVLAMVGGRDFNDSQFNRATQARRQAGSAFKPFVFSAALDSGYAADSVLDDGPHTFLDPTTREPWEPANFGDKYYGKVLFRTALVRSLNLATVRLADAIGARAVRDRAQAMGIGGDIPPYLSISLGSTDVTLLSMCRAYTAFARGGSWIEPQFVLSVSDRSGRQLFTAEPRVVNAIHPANAFIITTILKDVIRSGTATVCRSLGRPAAGKTGTSNEARDGWFIGYTPYLVTGVWVGFDDASPMGDEGVGGRVAAPIWLRYRQAIEDGYPVEDFRRPSGVVLRTVSAREAGATGDGDAMFELPFLAEPVPMH